MQRNLSGGFTLIELFIVTTIMLILASIAYPVYTSTQERARATQDMSNLRQIGLATQMYLNDNDGVLFAPNTAWPTSLVTKYLPSWKIFRSPFDTNYNSSRPDSENSASAPVSYGLNANAKAGASGGALSMDKVVNSGGFILFAPAQNADSSPHFQGVSNATITVLQDASVPGGTALGGTHIQRKRINVCFADMHQENYAWIDFKSDNPEAGSTATKSQRWHPDPANP
jgi:prepilin-type N-terminal cleavage/methylation domain-containing protein